MVIILIENFNKFYTMTPMKYYDCGGDFSKPKAQAMLKNEGKNYVATKKNDGEWCRLIIDAEGNIKAQSRSISKVTGEYGDKTEHIPHIIAELRNYPKETVLLGELCFKDITKTSKDVGSILRCKPDKAVQRQKDTKLVLRVFDCLAFAGVDLTDKPYWERLVHAEYCVLGFDDYIQITNYITEGDFEEFLQEILAAGGEGIVIHRKDAKYKPGARTAWDTLKVKKIVEEIELPIVNFLAPNKLYSGEDASTWKYWIGTKADGTIVKSLGCPDSTEDIITWEPVTKPFWMGWFNGVTVDNNGTLVKVTSGLTDEDREWLASEEAMQLLREGRLTAVISAMEIVKDSLSLRHPRLIRIRTEA